MELIRRLFAHNRDQDSKRFVVLEQLRNIRTSDTLKTPQYITRFLGESTHTADHHNGRARRFKTAREAKAAAESRSALKNPCFEYSYNVMKVIEFTEVAR